VAVAALEPHFAASLCKVAGVAEPDLAMRAPATRAAVTAFFASRTSAELQRLAVERDLPLHCME